MLVFLKLGGSLITDKDKPLSARKDVIQQAVREVKTALDKDPELKIILGHGSGSFGHTPAKIHNTINGVSSASQWKGFAEVWKAARDLNQIVMTSLAEAGIPSICFPPSSQVLTSNRRIIHWETANIELLPGTILPVVHGDVVLDKKIKGTILSTEDLFAYLAKKLHPDRILLAGIEEGVYLDFPNNSKILKNISFSKFNRHAGSIQGSAFADVTGGMRSKVDIMMHLLDKRFVKSVSIFNGKMKGAILATLLGGFPGTTLTRA